MAMVTKPRQQQTQVDESGVRWIPSACSTCYAQCSIQVKVKDGLPIKIEGNPNSPVGSGHLCPKGVSGLNMLYDPNRLNVPLMRTNPEKGLGVDPKWKEITWDEALDIITEKLRKIRAEDPRKLFYQRTTTSPNSANYGNWWAAAFGTPNEWAAGGGVHCGNGAHQLSGTFHGSWSLVPDFELCDYAIYFGASKGHSAGHVTNANALKAAEARARGMKMVVVDPMCNFAASKASEWVPIRVGTDAALALAMVNVLLNELNIYDAEHIKHKTNGPYLIGPDWLYVRDPATGKPLVWDTVAQRAKVYDDPSIGDFAILGEFEVNGVKCQPSFQLIKDGVKSNTPEYAEEITTIPAQRIRRLAREFGHHARVGSTIEIDGKRLPYRPVAAIFFRGTQGHKNSVNNCLAVELLNQVVGASDVPGGALGFCPAIHGGPVHPDRPYYNPYPGPDGLLVPGTWLGAHKPYPPSDPTDKPQMLLLQDLFPLCMHSATLLASDREELWNQFGIDYRPEMLVNFGSNPVLSVGNPAQAVEALKQIPFIVSFDLYITEFSELADIVLPDTSYLERLDPQVQFPTIRNHPSGQGIWAWPIRQPVIPLQGQRRHFVEVLMELAERVGFLAEYNAMFNAVFGLKDEYKLELDRRYGWEEICDRRLKCVFGDDHGLEWFQENGVMTWPKKVEEVYFLPFTEVRLPIYYEFMKRVGDKEREIFKQFNFDHRVDWNQYHPVPGWHPCPSHEVKDPSYDLWGFYYRDVLHANSFTYENPVLHEMASMNPHSYYAVVNTRAGKAKGLQSGDPIIIESPTGRKVKARVMLSEAIHPEALGVAGCGGHTTDGQPIAKGVGIRFNELLEMDFDHYCPVNLNLDLCVKVKIYKDPHPEQAL